MVAALISFFLYKKFSLASHIFYFSRNQTASAPTRRRRRSSKSNLRPSQNSRRLPACEETSIHHILFLNLPQTYAASGMMRFRASPDICGVSGFEDSNPLCDGAGAATQSVAPRPLEENKTSTSF